jgi:hypothetical protein
MVNVLGAHCLGENHDTFEKYRSYRQSGHYGAALDCLERLPASEIGKHPFHFLRGELLFNVGKYRDAYNSLVESESRMEKLPEQFLLLKGKCAVKIDKTALAVASFVSYATNSSSGIDRDNRVASAITNCFTRKADRRRFLDECGRRSACPRIRIWKGLVAMNEGKNEIASDILDDFLKDYPDDQRCLYWRCRVAIYLNTPGIAMQYYRKLLEVDSLHAGGFNVLEVPKTSDFVAPAHGVAQVRAMLKDRPQLGAAYDERNPLHVWTAIQFASNVVEAPIEWSNRFDEHGEVAAYHEYLRRSNKWIVCVREENDGKRRSADQQWSSLLFELENIKNQDMFTNLRQLAAHNKIDKIEFVTLTTALEFEAERRTKAFYALAFYPWSVANNYASSPADWEVSVHLTIEDVLDATNESTDVWKSYCDEYDQLRFDQMRKEAIRK